MGTLTRNITSTLPLTGVACHLILMGVCDGVAVILMVILIRHLRHSYPSTFPSNAYFFESSCHTFVKRGTLVENIKIFRFMDSSPHSNLVGFGEF